MLYNVAFGALAILSTTVDACPGPTCHVILEDNRGNKKQFNLGDHRNLGNWNDKAVALEVVGGSKCQIFGWEHVNMGGSAFAFGGNHRHWKLLGGIKNRISSLRVQWNGRRRRAEVTGDVFESHDPLCEAVMAEGLLTGWSFADDEATQAEEIRKLRDYCAEEFDGEELTQCLFYIHAMTEYFDSEELVEQLRFDAGEETLADEYQRCGILTNKLNKAIEDGEVSGIEMITKDGKDYFKMQKFEKEITKHHLVQATTSSDGVLRAVVSIGSVISTLIGAKLALVCKDFGADGRWLLQ